MPDVTISLTGDLHFHDRAAKMIHDGLAHPGAAPELDAMFRQFADFYANFIRRRFVELSRSGGGGEWPPLALSTILARRPYARGNSKRKITAKRKDARAQVRTAAASGNEVPGAASILYDTGQLFGTLTIGAEGNVSERAGPTISFGIGGSAKHQDSKGSVRHAVTLGQLAAYHQAGGGHLPQRQILVKPPDGAPVYRQMQRAGNDAVAKVLARAANQGREANSP